MYKIIAIMGEAGTGKDTLMQEVLKVHPFHEIVSCTTRPPREGEVDGINYHFLTNEEFAAKVLNDEMLEATEFNNWFYGTGLESLSKDEINIGVFNPTGIESLLAHRDKVKVIVKSKDELTEKQSIQIQDVVKNITGKSNVMIERKQ